MQSRSIHCGIGSIQGEVPSVTIRSQISRQLLSHQSDGRMGEGFAYTLVPISLPTVHTFSSHIHPLPHHIHPLAHQSTLSHTTLTFSHTTFTLSHTTFTLLHSTFTLLLSLPHSPSSIPPSPHNKPHPLLSDTEQEEARHSTHSL